VALNGLFCADVPLENYSLTHWVTGNLCKASGHSGETAHSAFHFASLSSVIKTVRHRLPANVHWPNVVCNNRNRLLVLLWTYCELREQPDVCHHTWKQFLWRSPSSHPYS